MEERPSSGRHQTTSSNHVSSPTTAWIFQLCLISAFGLFLMWMKSAKASMRSQLEDPKTTLSTHTPFPTADLRPNTSKAQPGSARLALALQLALQHRPLRRFGAMRGGTRSRGDAQRVEQTDRRDAQRCLPCLRSLFLGNEGMKMKMDEAAMKPERFGGCV